MLFFIKPLVKHVSMVKNKWFLDSDFNIRIGKNLFHNRFKHLNFTKASYTGKPIFLYF